MKTATVSIYSFSELSDKAKARALDNHRHDTTNDNYWYDFVYEEWREKLEALGYENVDFSFALAWSQGDGACFTANIDLGEWLRKQKLYNKYRLLYLHREDVTAKVIDIDGRDCHEYSVRADLEYSPWNWNSKVYEQSCEVQDLITEDVRELCRELYRELRDECEYMMEDDYIGDFLEANDYEFDQYGNDFRHAYALAA
jgi:hypothetical protein